MDTETLFAQNNIALFAVNVNVNTFDIGNPGQNAFDNGLALALILAVNDQSDHIFALEIGPLQHAPDITLMGAFIIDA